MRVAGALLPGAGQLLGGQWATGLGLLLPWLALLSVPVFHRDRIAAVARAGSPDGWIALATLVLALGAVWAAAWRSLVRQPAPAATASPWRIAWRRLGRNRPARLGLWLLAALCVATLLAPLITTWDPTVISPDMATTRFQAPSATHWLGTDQFGRDVLSRLLYGARISLSIGLLATAIAVGLGTLIGAVAGYAGGRTDALLMRLTDLALAFPRLVLLILVVALFGRSVTVLVLVLGLTQWPATTRIVRGDVLSLRERDFIQAARALGLGGARIVLRHIVPNVMAPVIVAATLGVGNTITLEAGLSFLGLGPLPPTPSWGAMVLDGASRLAGLDTWWLATFPGLTIVLVVLAFNVLGDGLRDALDPRLGP
jgi:ABC-type dipeptide/oligopeptide/nickel transport system permease subunit